MKMNITAGDCLNAILTAKYPTERFIPFCEAMIQGEYTAKLFSEAFIQERARTHNVSIETYKAKLNGFLAFLNEPNRYTHVVLWFGDEPFCQANVKTVLQTLKEYRYHGKITFNTVVEETGEIVTSEVIS